MARLESRIPQILAATPAACSAALLKTAADIVEVTKQLSPVDTGALKQSYGAVPLSSTSVRIGSDKEYAPYVELGTSRMAAQPHLTPAFAQAEETFKANVIEEMKKIT